ncbi:cyclic nucleotide-binding domain-containing protein [Candidatus Villigracilis vicinus]|uniref:cyclic nucleotide-binding domain-containing protein n=1 Tax=Candidatus Villigracilis vicinus TaxID=3140679 RepID=UPI0031EE3AEB
MKPSELLRIVRCGKSFRPARSYFGRATEIQSVLLGIWFFESLGNCSFDGREQVLRFLDAGEIFNEIGVLAKRPNPVTAVALEEPVIGSSHATRWKRW